MGQLYKVGRLGDRAIVILMARSNNFRLKGKNLFLTYPQFDCDLDLEDILDTLKNRVLPQNVVKYVIAHEHHADGASHIHCYLGLDGTFSTRAVNHFDIGGIHGNYQVVRSPKAVIKYCSKEEDYIAEGVDIKVTWDVIRASSTKKEFLEMVASYRPRDYILSFDKINAYADAMYKAPFVPRPIRDITSFTVPQELSKFFTDYKSWVTGSRQDRFKSLVVCSPSQYGKTSYVESICQHLEISTCFNVGAWNARAMQSGYDLLVFDDLEFDEIRWSTIKPLLAGQWNVTVTDKYLKKTCLPHGKHIVWLCNDLRWYTGMDLDRRDYIDKNCIIVDLLNKLY